MSSSASNSIDVDFCVTYLTETGGVTWTDENYQAMKMVKAVKGNEYNGYISIKVAGEDKKIYSENAAEFRKIAHQPLARMIGHKYPSPLAIVPIPSSKTTLGNCENFLTKTLADRAANALGNGYYCAPILVFHSEMPSTRSGGSRSPYYIESQLQLVNRVNNPIVLLDDVMTLGGHLKAAFWRLEGEGMKVLGAVTFARTVKDNSITPLGPHTERLDVSKTQMNWDF